MLQVLEPYEQLQQKPHLANLLPKLKRYRLQRSKPKELHSPEEALDALQRGGHPKGWVTCEDRALVVDGPWHLAAGDGVILNADLSLDGEKSLQLRHKGGTQWILSELTETELGADAPDDDSFLGQDVTFVLQPSAGEDRSLLYRRYWAFDEDGMAHASLSRLVGFEDLRSSPR